MTSLRDAIGAFLAAQAGEVSVSTRRWYSKRLGAFASWAGDVPLNALTVALLRAYRAYLIDSGLSPHTTHGHQRALRRLCSWLAGEGDIPRNVARDVPLVRLPAQPPKAVQDDDVARLLAHLPSECARDRAIILLLIDTGCRVGGLCSLTVDDLDLARRCALVTEKGQRSRRVYFGDVTAAAIGVYLAARPVLPSPALFLSRRNTRLTENGVRLMLEKVGKRAGVVGRCNAHAFRHAFARSFLRNGGNLATLGRILGHAPGSPVTAKYYAVFDDHELQEFHGRFGPLSGAGDYQAPRPESGGVLASGTKQHGPHKP